jgi:hypothetical protein
MKTGTLLLLLIIVIAIGLFTFDKMYTSKLESKFTELEKQRIITSNKLATAKIVYENLNHVRDLVFKNMDFPDQKDSVLLETIFFDFLTTCINDLKLKLVSVKPLRPQTLDRITTYGYDLEIEGDFFKFGELCAKFENSRRILSLETFDVTLLSDKANNKSDIKGISVKMRV